jgi:hypothetical protein
MPTTEPIFGATVSKMSPRLGEKGEDRRDRCGQREAGKYLEFEPLLPEVARHHQVRTTRS